VNLSKSIFGSLLCQPFKTLRFVVRLITGVGLYQTSDEYSFLTRCASWSPCFWSNRLKTQSFYVTSWRCLGLLWRWKEKVATPAVANQSCSSKGSQPAFTSLIADLLNWCRDSQALGHYNATLGDVPVVLYSPGLIGYLAVHSPLFPYVRLSPVHMNLYHSGDFFFFITRFCQSRLNSISTSCQIGTLIHVLMLWAPFH
jgi:hypothetical protein